MTYERKSDRSRKAANTNRFTSLSSEDWKETKLRAQSIIGVGTGFAQAAKNRQIGQKTISVHQA